MSSLVFPRISVQFSDKLIMQHLFPHNFFALLRKKNIRKSKMVFMHVEQQLHLQCIIQNYVDLSKPRFIFCAFMNEANFHTGKALDRFFFLYNLVPDDFSV